MDIRLSSCGAVGRSGSGSGGCDIAINSGSSCSGSHRARRHSEYSVDEWRSEGVVSDGGSSRLATLQRSRSRTPRRSTRSLRKPTYITSIAEDLQWAIRELLGGGCGVGQQQQQHQQQQPPDWPVLERWSIYIHETLTRESRGYHTVEHAFEISAGASPAQLIAAFFRNTVSNYIDGDDSLTDRQRGLLSGVLVPDSCILNPDLGNGGDGGRGGGGGRCDLMVAALFDYSPGQDLQNSAGQHKGLDVFLSAIAACRLLGDTLSLKHLAKVCTCLEGTIPFRNVGWKQANAAAATTTTDTTSSSSPTMEALYQRLVAVNSAFDLQFTEEEMAETVQQAADLLNRSVGNMVSDDLTEFINHTWRLLPEHNAALRQRALYTVADYYTAVGEMASMLQNINAAAVYERFRNIPDMNETAGFRHRLEVNLAMAVVYLRAQYFSAAVVSAFACLSGGCDSVPHSFFYGDLPGLNHHHSADRLGLGLLSAAPEAETDGDLSCGRSNDNDNDNDSSNSGGRQPVDGDGDGDGGAEALFARNRRHRRRRRTSVHGKCYYVEVYDLLRNDDGMLSSSDTTTGAAAAAAADDTYYCVSRTAPFAAYLYRALGHDAQADLLNCGCCPLPVMTERAAVELLRRLPVPVVETAGREVARMAVSRSSRIERLLLRLQQNETT